MQVRTNFEITLEVDIEKYLPYNKPQDVTQWFILNYYRLLKIVDTDLLKRKIQKRNIYIEPKDILNEFYIKGYPLSCSKYIGIRSFKSHIIQGLQWFISNMIRKEQKYLNDLVKMKEEIVLKDKASDNIWSEKLDVKDLIGFLKVTLALSKDESVIWNKNVDLIVKNVDLIFEHIIGNSFVKDMAEDLELGKNTLHKWLDIISKFYTEY